MNVLLTTSAAPELSPFSTTEKRPPIGVGYLISVLRREGHSVRFIDNYLKPTRFIEEGVLEKESIDVVGIYCNTICLRDTLRMVEAIDGRRRAGTWGGKIVVGGPHASVAPETLPPAVDHIVQGEGERALVDLLSGAEQGRVVKATRIEDLDRLPRLPWDLFTRLPYDFSVPWFPEKPVFTMNTSRGCPHRCTFCSVGSVWGRSYTAMSAGRIIEEIEALTTEYGAKGIYFREDNFTLNRARVTTFCETLLDRGLDLKWVCEARVSSLDRELLGLMGRAGCRALYLGVESGSPRMLDFLKKGITVEQIGNVFSWCKETGIRTAASFVVGVPGETDDDLKASLQLANRISPDTCWWNIFVGIPTSELYRYAFERDLVEAVDDRGLAYLKGHDARVDRFYGGLPTAKIPKDVRRLGQPPASASVSASGNGRPKVSVVMSVHNGEPHLAKAIQSVREQSFDNFEFIIVDDGSGDRTAAIVGAFRDKRIRIWRQQRRGLTRSLNKGIELARGDYVARMDADDMSMPERLARQVAFLDTHPEVALVGTSFHVVDDQDQFLTTMNVLAEDGAIRKGLLEQNWFCHGSVMFRASAFRELGGYDETFDCAQDYDLWLRLSRDHKLANIPEPLYIWRRSATGISTMQQARQECFAERAREKARVMSEEGAAP